MGHILSKQTSRAMTLLATEALHINGYPKDLFKVEVFGAKTEAFPNPGKQEALWIRIKNRTTGDFVQLPGAKSKGHPDGMKECVGLKHFIFQTIKQ